MTEVMIDPNVRVAGGLTFSGFEDIRGPIPVSGQQVLVREPEANLVAVGTVRRIDENDRLIYISVDWTQLAPDHLPTPEEFLRERRAAVSYLTTAPVYGTSTQCPWMSLWPHPRG